jgi:hypothetical protein
VRFVGRVFLYVFGLVLAIPAGLTMFAIGLAVEPAAQELVAALGMAGFEDLVSDLWDEGMSEAVPGTVFLRLWALSAALFVLPPALVGLIGEIAGTRSFVWYGFGCGALMAALPWLARGGARLEDGQILGAEGRITALLFVTGAATGLTYWLVAGRSAGPRD